jgi:uncharacterized repeat protein (TIGR01451 family)
MRRFAALAVLLSAMTLSPLVSAPAQAMSVLTVPQAVTDNYKPKWNADPSIQEKRTWFQFGTAVTVDGVAYRPQALPGAGAQFTESLPVAGSDGSSAVLTISTPADRISSDVFRTDATGYFGPLLTLTDPTTLKGHPINVTVTLSKGGVAVAATTASYTWDAALNSVPADHVEYNSPGGRYWFGCKPTRADWEAAAPADTCTANPSTADLSVSLTSSANVAVGNGFNYTMTVVNSGASTATGVEVQDVVPAQLRTQSVIPGAGTSCSGTVTVRCSVAALAPGAKATIVIQAVAVAPGTLTNTVTASSSTADPTPANNSASRNVVAEGFACTVIGTPGPDTLAAPSTSRAVLCGLGGVDVLTGLGGSDQLYGGDGNDTLNGGAGNDVLTGGPGDDTIDGGTHTAGGADRISYADARSSMVVNLGQLHAWDDGSVAGDAAVGYDAFTGVEGAIGSPFDDQLLGGVGADRLEGVGGADLIYGYGGNDQLDGGVGNDSVFGQAGNDTLGGHNGNDRLTGGSGVDGLDGQAGIDTCAAGGDAGDNKVNCEL